MFRQRSGLIGAGILAVWLVAAAAAWAGPSQADIDFCNKQAADGMASIGERDGIYRFAYAVCLHQHSH
jgi:hypothetical protein